MAQKAKNIELAEIIRRQIVSKQLSPGDQLEAIPKLAKHYGTTIATVSKALASLEEGGYIKRFPGKGVFVENKTSCRLAVVIDTDYSFDNMSISFLPLFINGLDIKCRELNWTQQLFFAVDDQESAHDFIMQLNQHKFDVVLVASRWVAENIQKLLVSSSAAMIGLFDYKDFPCRVIFDTYDVINRAVESLNQQNCEQIAFIDLEQDNSWRGLPNNAENGYIEGLKNAGHLYTPALHKKVFLTQLGGINGFYKLLKKKTTSPMGIIVSDSLITLGVIQGILSKGLKIPEDIIIATHANKGCGTTDFPFPVIKLEYSITKLLDQIINMAQKHLSGRSLLQDVVLIKTSLNNPFLNN